MLLYEYAGEKDLKFSISDAEEFSPEILKINSGIINSKENYSKDSEENSMGNNSKNRSENHIEDSVRYIIEFESPFKSGIDINDRVCAELFLPADKKSLLVKDKDSGKNTRTREANGTSKYPGTHAGSGEIVSNNNEALKIIILIHGYGCREGRRRNYNYFIKNAIKNNYAVLFLHLPYHLSRTPEGEKSGSRIKAFTQEETLNAYNQSVLDVRKLIDVCNRLFPVQPDYFICGLSLGGIVAMITTAWEPLIKKAVFLQIGGNWNEIYYKSTLNLLYLANYKGRSKKEELEQIYSEYPEFLEKYKKINPREIDLEMSNYPDLSRYSQRVWFLSDPLTFAHKINPDRVLMINSLHDIHFPKKSIELLHEELGRPRIYWTNDFHTTLILRQEGVLKTIFDFLGK
ncbi:MAG: hypothetical protein PHG41_04480 [Actinomycetota bacterium]|nr:hypothetical protein [Actinomycetota bacterium]